MGETARNMVMHSEATGPLTTDLMGCIPKGKRKERTNGNDYVVFCHPGTRAHFSHPTRLDDQKMQ